MKRKDTIGDFRMKITVVKKVTFEAAVSAVGIKANFAPAGLYMTAGGDLVVVTNASGGACICYLDGAKAHLDSTIDGPNGPVTEWEYIYLVNTDCED